MPFRFTPRFSFSVLLQAHKMGHGPVGKALHVDEDPLVVFVVPQRLERLVADRTSFVSWICNQLGLHFLLLGGGGGGRIAGIRVGLEGSRFLNKERNDQNRKEKQEKDRAKRLRWQERNDQNRKDKQQKSQRWRWQMKRKTNIEERKRKERRKEIEREQKKCVCLRPQRRSRAGRARRRREETRRAT